MRRLYRNKTFAGICVLSLALGIGATTAGCCDSRAYSRPGPIVAKLRQCTDSTGVGHLILLDHFATCVKGPSGRAESVTGRLSHARPKAA